MVSSLMAVYLASSIRYSCLGIKLYKKIYIYIKIVGTLEIIVAILVGRLARILFGILVRIFAGNMI